MVEGVTSRRDFMTPRIIDCVPEKNRSCSAQRLPDFFLSGCFYDFKVFKNSAIVYK